MSLWLEPPPVTVPEELLALTGGALLPAEILARRGFNDPARALAFLDPNAYHPAPSMDFPGMEAACLRIEQAVARGQRVWIWGDFDVDGQTSTALLVETLRLLGANPGYHIPVRARESHGVNIPQLQSICADGADLIVTCDTGITAHEALNWASVQGLDVIVTDHHALGETLPLALAHITPRLLPSGHPMETLPGAGVAYKLAEALLSRAGRETETERMLDLVALGIVADVAVQTGDARYLLQRGLDRLRRTERAGLRAMFKLAELQPAFLNEEHIGFALAPRLNALGRLSDANPAVELLTTAQPERAENLARELEALNAQRQLLTRQVTDAALAQIERDPTLLEPPVLVLSHPNWPGGVIGIVASQLVARYNRPVVLLSTPPGENARGSARSVEGVDIAACIAEQAALLTGYGGHPGAAGLSLPAENLPAFRRGLARSVTAALERAGRTGAPEETQLTIDAWLDIEQATLDLADDLARLAPFGPGNPPLVFAAHGLRVTSSVPIGRGGERSEHLQLTVEDPAGKPHKVLWWGGASQAASQETDLFQGQIDLAYTLRASNYRGQREAALEWVAHRHLVQSPLEIRSERFEILDHRTARHPRPILDALLAEGEAVVWAEGQGREHVGGLDRCALPPALLLIIWTQPPGRSELRAVLQQVKPRRLALFAMEPGDDTLEGFLRRLFGLVKFDLKRAGGQSAIPIQKLAAACAQREATVRLALQRLHATGAIQLEAIENDAARITPGGGKPTSDAGDLDRKLRILLAETAAYRRMYATAPVETVLA